MESKLTNELGLQIVEDNFNLSNKQANNVQDIKNNKKDNNDVDNIKIEDRVFVDLASSFAPWRKGTILSIVNDDYLRIKIELEVKLLTKKKVALFKENYSHFPVGSRVIAKYHNTPREIRKAFYYSGIVGEIPEPKNVYR